MPEKRASREEILNHSWLSNITCTEADLQEDIRSRLENIEKNQDTLKMMEADFF